MERASERVGSTRTVDSPHRSTPIKTNHHIVTPTTSHRLQEPQLADDVDITTHACVNPLSAPDSCSRTARRDSLGSTRLSEPVALDKTRRGTANVASPRGCSWDVVAQL